MIKLSLIFTIFIGHTVFCQISIGSNLTPKAVVETILLGNGVSASNIRYNGDLISAGVVQHNVGSFERNGTNFPINEGVLITTGKLEIAQGPNTNIKFDTLIDDPYQDVDLLLMSDSAVTNGACLEFDFVAISDTFSFKYIFASEEYNFYVGSTFNDVFGFFLSGPGIQGIYSNNAVNLATLPATDTGLSFVSINNVNLVNNSKYYTNNEDSQAYANAIEYNGTTTLLSAGSKLVCGQTYHIKLCLSNAFDQAFGSGVFIQGKSFTTSDLSFAMPKIKDGGILEDCPSSKPTIVLNRPIAQIGAELKVNFVFSGTAISEEDYVALPSSALFKVGESSVSIPISIVDDNVAEGKEFILIKSSYTNVCGFVISFTDTLFILDPVDVKVTTQDYTYYCPTMNSICEVTSGISPFTYAWSNGSSSNPLVLSDGIQAGLNEFEVTVTDFCGNVASGKSLITYLPIHAEIQNTSVIYPVNSNVIFQNVSQNGTSFLWDLPKNQTVNSSDLSSQSYYFSETGEYQVMLVARNGLCVDSTIVKIVITDYPQVMVPNVFTPNNDGVNEKLTLNTKFVKNLDLKIVDRWGMMIFEESSSEPIWNGLDLNGNKVSNGVYYYLFTAEGYIGSPLKGQGFIEVVGD